MRKLATVRKISEIKPIEGADKIELACIDESEEFIFYYDETSPSYLRWACNRYSGKMGCKLEAKKGDPAGSIHSSGYYRVMLNGKRVFAHRVIWKLHFGEIPEGCFIDHIDGNILNNQIENLRIVSMAGNSRNHKKRSTNKSGVTGVCLTYTHKGKYPMYTAYWRALDGSVCTKSFSVGKYGEEGAFLLACKCRESAIKELNKFGAGYTDRHTGQRS